MKKTFTKIMASAFMLIGIQSASFAGTTALFGSLSSITTTSTNSPSVQSGTASMPKGTFQISTSGLTATNQAAFFEQVSLDGTNWITVNKFTLSNTNDTESFNGGNYSSPTIYTRIYVTNSVNFSAGGSYTQ